MDLSFTIAGAVALGVALILMYVVLRKYTFPAVEEPFFSDPTLFILFTVGLIEGTILFVAYTYVMPYYSSAGVGLIIAIMFGIVTEMVKLVTLNLKRFAGKSDSIFYGFGLGLGMGAAMGFGMIYYLTSRTSMDAASWAIVLTLSLQNIFLHSGTGIRVGEGVARKSVMDYTMKALFFNIAFQLLVLPTFSISAANDLYWISYITLALAAILVVYNLYVTVWRKLPRIVDEVLRMEGKKRKDIPGL